MVKISSRKIYQKPYEMVRIYSLEEITDGKTHYLSVAYLTKADN